MIKKTNKNTKFDNYLNVKKNRIGDVIPIHLKLMGNIDGLIPIEDKKNKLIKYKKT